MSACLSDDASWQHSTTTSIIVAVMLAEARLPTAAIGVLSWCSVSLSWCAMLQVHMLLPHAVCACAELALFIRCSC